PGIRGFTVFPGLTIYRSPLHRYHCSRLWVAAWTEVLRDNKIASFCLRLEAQGGKGEGRVPPWLTSGVAQASICEELVYGPAKKTRICCGTGGWARWVHKWGRQLTTLPTPPTSGTGWCSPRPAQGRPPAPRKTPHEVGP